jgi:phosphate transport system protein
MVHGALAAFAAEDVDMARRVVALDDQVDALNRQTFTDLLAESADDPDMVKRSMSLILLARSLERIADHAENICEEVVFLVKGEDIRHQA